MFDKKYKKVMAMIDEESEIAYNMLHGLLTMYEPNDPRTGEEFMYDLTHRNGLYAKVDQYQARLDSLYELKRRIERELES